MTVIHVSAMSHVMVLPDVEGIFIILAVVRVVADWLHAVQFALVDHDVCVGPALLRGHHRKKEDFPCRHTVLAPEHRKRALCPDKMNQNKEVNINTIYILVYSEHRERVLCPDIVHLGSASQQPSQYS